MVEIVARRVKMKNKTGYTARPDSLSIHSYFPGKAVEAKSLEELARRVRRTLTLPLSAIAVGGQSVDARQLCEDSLEAGLLRDGDTLSVIGGFAGSGHDDVGKTSAFGDWFARSRGPQIRTRSIDWHNATQRERLRTRTFDVVIYAAEHVEEALAFRILSRHSSLSLVNLPANATKAFRAVAKEATVGMGAAFAKAPEGAHCIPLITTGTPSSVKRFLGLAINCRDHTQSSCSMECPAFVASEILQPLLSTRR